MEIITKNIDDLIPYKNNPRNNKDSIDLVANSIKEFGFKVPIIIDKNNIIVTGHTRLLAAKKLGLKTVPCISADDLTDVQIKAFRLADNKVSEKSTWDEKLLQGEINELFDTKEDMKSFGFDIDNLGLILDDKPDVDVTATKKSSLNKYSKKIDIPQYEIVGEKPKLSECYDTTKYDALMLDIINSDIPDEEKKMLKYAAARHIVFNYGKIAEYYAGSEIPTQQLMEDSALIIIDFEDAIRDGYVLLNKNVEEIRMQEDGAEPMVDEYTDDDSEV